jgi:thiol:disulfide interchange protein
MSTLFTRTAMVPVWLVAFGLIALFGSLPTSAPGVVLLIMAGLALTIMLVVWKDLHPTLATMRAPAPPRATLPSTDFVPNSWPDSGFRTNLRRRTIGELGGHGF